MDSAAAFELFCESHFSKGLKSEEQRLLFSISKELTLDPGEYLLKEGDRAEHFYVILEGDLEVSKHDQVQAKYYEINHLGPGEIVGEVSLIDHGARTASIKAVIFSTLRSIAFEDLQSLIGKHKELAPLFFRLSESVAKKLRLSNTFALQSLEHELEAANLRAKMGVLFIGIVSILSLVMYGLEILKYWIRKAPNTTYVSFPTTLIIGALFFLMVKTFNVPYHELGITRAKWKQSLFEGIVVTTLLSASFFAFFKWLLVQFIPHYYGRPLFEPFLLIQDPANKNWLYWIQINIAYVFLMVPIQELVCRGGLQGLLEKFLVGKYRVVWSIVVSNMIFSSVHVYLSPYAAIGVFFSGCYFGILYYRTRNLLASYCAHVIVGLSCLSIFGIVSGIFN